MGTAAPCRPPCSRRRWAPADGSPPTCSGPLGRPPGTTVNRAPFPNLPGGVARAPVRTLTGYLPGASVGVTVPSSQTRACDAGRTGGGISARPLQARGLCAATERTRLTQPAQPASSASAGVGGMVHPAWAAAGEASEANVPLCHLEATRVRPAPCLLAAGASRTAGAVTACFRWLPGGDRGASPSSLRRPGRQSRRRDRAPRLAAQGVAAPELLVLATSFLSFLFCPFFYLPCRRPSNELPQQSDAAGRGQGR